MKCSVCGKEIITVDFPIAEDLCIDIDTDNPEIISVNGSKYRLVT